MLTASGEPKIDHFAVAHLNRQYYRDLPRQARWEARHLDARGNAMDISAGPLDLGAMTAHYLKQNPVLTTAQRRRLRKKGRKLHGTSPAGAQVRTESTADPKETA